MTYLCASKVVVAVALDTGAHFSNCAPARRRTSELPAPETKTSSPEAVGRPRRKRPSAGGETVAFAAESERSQPAALPTCRSRPAGCVLCLSLSSAFFTSQAAGLRPPMLLRAGTSASISSVCNVLCRDSCSIDCERAGDTNCKLLCRIGSLIHCTLLSNARPEFTFGRPASLSCAKRADGRTSAPYLRPVEPSARASWRPKSRPQTSTSAARPRQIRAKAEAGDKNTLLPATMVRFGGASALRLAPSAPLAAR